MTIKYLSLSMVAATVAVLVGGTAAVANKASAIVKRPAQQIMGLSIPEFKPERAIETSNFKLSLGIYERTLALHSQASPASPASQSPAQGIANLSPEKPLGSEPLFAGSGAPAKLAPPTSVFAKAERPQTKAAAAKPKEALAIQTQNLGDVKPAPAISLPKVSVVVVDGKSNKAMINGSLVGVNTQLTGGYVVKEINIDSVILGHGGEDILIKIPLQRLRVLGATETRQANGAS